MVVLSYLWSRKHYAIPYRVGRIMAYMGAALLIYLCNKLILQQLEGPKNIWALLLLLVYGMAVLAGERKTFLKYKST